jgi:hypothetical protein
MSIETSDTEPAAPARLRRRGARLLAASAVTLATLFAAPHLASASPAPPTVPGNIAVPAVHVLSDVGHAQGFQIYTCQPQGTGYGWVLQQPMAVLLQEGHKPFALHYGGPTWMAMDGSSVTATRVDGAPAPSGTAIPWLLLKATPQNAPAGGTFSSTTFIQRLNTTGGLAPATGCDAGHVGATAPVFYTADYYFYQAG